MGRRPPRENSMVTSRASSLDPLDCIDQQSSRDGSAGPFRRPLSDVGEGEMGLGAAFVVKTSGNKRRRLRSISENDAETSSKSPVKREPQVESMQDSTLDPAQGSHQRTPLATSSPAHPNHVTGPPSMATELLDTVNPPSPNIEPAATLPPISAGGVLPIDLQPDDPHKEEDADISTTAHGLPAENQTIKEDDSTVENEETTQTEVVKVAAPDVDSSADNDETGEPGDISNAEEATYILPTPPATSLAPAPQAAIKEHIDVSSRVHPPDVTITKEVNKEQNASTKTMMTPEATGNLSPDGTPPATTTVTAAHGEDDPMDVDDRVNVEPPSDHPEGSEVDVAADLAPSPIDEQGEEELEILVSEWPKSVSASRTDSSAPTSALNGKPAPKKSGLKPKSQSSATSKKDVKGRPTSGKTKRPVKSKAKSKADDLKTVSSKARSASVSESARVSASVASSEIPAHREDTIDPEDTAVYCVCRKMYSEEDEDVVMVACDACDNWFHPACVGIAGDKLDLLDTYICQECEQTTLQRSSYKRLCKRDRCDKSTVGQSSKYCSSSCAFQHMAEQVPPTANKKLLKQLASAFIGLPPPKIQVISTHHVHMNPIPSSNRDEAQGLRDQIQVVTTAMHIVDRRREILQEAIANCENLPLVNMSNGDAATGKRSKDAKGVKGVKGGGEDRPCGWDARLVWDDAEVQGWSGDVDEGGEAGQVCMVARRRCDRHQGWQKTSAVSLDLEFGQLSRRKEMLERQMALLETSVSAEKASMDAREMMAKRLISTTG